MDACLLFCYQAAVVAECGCADPQSPGHADKNPCHSSVQKEERFVFFLLCSVWVMSPLTIQSAACFWDGKAKTDPLLIL